VIRFTREQWGAKHGRGAIVPEPVDLVVIHHWWRPHIDAGATLAEEAERMRAVERIHGEERGWIGIGYNWCIYQSGHVYEGRGWGRSGAHTKGQNRSSVGIAFAMNGDEHRLTPAAIEACQDLLREGLEDGYIRENFRLRGHRDYAEKSCPGDFIYRHLDDLRPRSTQEETET